MGINIEEVNALISDIENSGPEGDAKASAANRAIKALGGTMSIEPLRTGANKANLYIALLLARQIAANKEQETLAVQLPGSDQGWVAAEIIELINRQINNPEGDK